ncbi:hypothetical protein K2173_023960 [Erythroxylum novogranatense]|uniref:Small RNA 2'-O-methyltransferase n=1 Tax=Erythroxylum novogranatense TaxID=1862640 RepID=A0AAV8TRV3_9ROSI|nr:hypothetical protein K2173_023960 [Erythroxylum novogranatense]
MYCMKDWCRELIPYYEHIQQNDFAYRRHKKHKEEEIAICECRFNENDPFSTCEERSVINLIAFDFLGKDSIQYKNTVEVEVPVAIGQFQTGSDLSGGLLEVTRDYIDNHKSEGDNILGRDLTDLEDNDESFECFHLPTEKFFFAFWLHLVFTILIGSCLEVIEHMEEDQALLFDDVALSYFHPKVLIISTPNYEYNVILQKSALS